MKYQVFLLLAALLLLRCAVSMGEAISDWHRVTNTYTDTKNDNKSVVRLWQVETANEAVTEEINGIARGWAEEKGPALPAQKNNNKGNSRLDVEIRYSRTGHTWLSFLVQARTQYRQKLTEQVIETRTYNMATGERITLKEIFDEAPETWTFLGNAVREGLTAFWPEEEPDAEKLEALCAREALEQADFTLHGMSLVLHSPADLLYCSCSCSWWCS